MRDCIDADHSVACIRTAEWRTPPDCAGRPAAGGVAAHRRQVELMLVDAEQEYRAAKHVRLEEAIAAQARIEVLQAVRQSIDVHLMKGGV